jgi:methionyl-tRNA synthetase
VLTTLVEGLRAVGVLLAPWLPDSSVRLLEALGTPDLTLAGAQLDGGRVQRVSVLEPLFPKQQD